MLVREYFMHRYREIRNGQGLGVYPGLVATADPSDGRPDPMAEYFVDRNATQFMADLEAKLGTLKSTLAELEEARQDAIVSRTINQASTRRRVKELAGRIGQKASDIFKMVALVVLDLRPEKNAGTRPRPASSEFLAAEVSVLEAEVKKAEDRINAMFLAPTHTVTVKELQGDNVLTELKSIESVTKEIQKTVLDSDAVE